ncbi:MAG: single-stranded-DNA-specific exonuclease RecJ [Syntrophomonadaceae bacterium]|jgi:single-stranded-DNA-specific exonuclease
MVEKTGHRIETSNIWEIKSTDKKLAENISNRLNISLLLANMLLQRGINTYEEAYYFLNANLIDLQHPFSLAGMELAVVRIRQAIQMEEKIAIYGDYDVDGICSVVLLKQCLDKLGARVDYFVPDRFTEGYGLNQQAVERLSRLEYNLLITVDCGITSVVEIQRARELGIDVIICDHHTPLIDIPEALGIINPKLDSPKELQGLCGAGVVFKLCQALCPDYALDKESSWLELAALATVADVVPLKGENRILVKYGLRRLPNTCNIGLQALIKASNLEGKMLSSWHIGFVLAPRLNSAGRLYSAYSSIELLLSTNKDKAHELALKICDINSERKMLEEAVYKEADLQAQKEQESENNLVMVLEGENWHQGVIGIVASRLCKKYLRPVILISWDQKIGRGSCRSLPGIDIYQSLSACSSYLIKFGGHCAAAGLSIDKGNYEQFVEAIRRWAIANISEEQLYPRQYADAELEPDQINEKLLQELAQLEPYGEGNPKPCFVVRGVKLQSAILIGKQKEHLRAHLESGDAEIIAFNRSDLIEYPIKFCYYDILFEPKENDYGGKKKVQLRLADIKNSLVADEPRAVTEYGRKLVQACYMSIEEIQAGRPVLFIYPTYRTLFKHRELMQSFFCPLVLNELHGHIHPSKRANLIDGFSQGLNRVYLVTIAFINYYLSKYSLPEKIKRIFALNPDQAIIDLQEKYQNCYIKTLQAPGRYTFTLGLADYDKRDRVLLYANRKTTVDSVTRNMENLCIEAGINDIRQRRTIRRNFMQYGGVLVSDGANTSVTGLDNTEVFFADAPYSIYEAEMVLNQLAAGTEKKARILFNRVDFEFNHRYLQRIYPGADLLKGMLIYCKKVRSNPFTTNLADIKAFLKAYLGQDTKPLEIMSALAIMADLDLCQFKKKGSIMAIKLNDHDYSKLNIKDSIYYLEGRAEKKELSRFQRYLKNIMTGD